MVYHIEEHTHINKHFSCQVSFSAIIYQNYSLNKECLIHYLYHHSARTKRQKMPALQDRLKPALNADHSQHYNRVEGLV